MKKLTVDEASAQPSELPDEVERGAQGLITRRCASLGRPVGGTPAVAQHSKADAQRQRVAQVFAKLAHRRQGVTLDGPLHEAIQHGRD